MTPSSFLPIHFGPNIPAGGTRSRGQAHLRQALSEPWSPAP